jgi:tol-pal system protein YbgF
MKRIACLLLLGVVLGASPSAQGGTKEELVRLQTDVLALTNQIRLLEKTVSEQTEGLKGLVGQLNDQMGKSNALLGKISNLLETRTASDRSSNQSLLQEVRSLNQKIDDAGTRISALAQQISELKVQSQPITERRFQTSGGDPGSLSMSADTIFNEAFNDLVQGNTDLAIQGFSSFVTNFPTSEKADDAQYYIGEAYYNSKKLPEAVAAFTKILNDYPSGDKVASSLYKRGLAEVALKEKQNAVEDFKAVLQRYPDSPEAGLARNQLESFGIDPSRSAKPSSSRRRP